MFSCYDASVSFRRWSEANTECKLVSLVERVRKLGVFAASPLRYAISGQTPISHANLRIGNGGKFPCSQNEGMSINEHNIDQCA